MKNILFISMALLTLFFLNNCGDSFATIVEIDPPEFEPQMTISSFINDQDSLTGFFVGKNRDILEAGEFEDYDLDDVSITVTKEASSEVLTGAPVDPFVNFAFAFTYNYALEIPDQFFAGGENYTFEVSHPDYNSSVTTLQFPIVKDNLRDIVYNQNDGVDIDGDDNSSVRFEIVDDPLTEDYYELELFSEDLNGNFGSFWIETTDPSGIKGYPYDNLLFSDQSFNGETKSIKVKFDRWLYNPDVDEPLKVIWRTLTKDAYGYSLSGRRYNDTDGTPFLSPVQLHSNVNDALGNISLKTEVVYLVE